MINLGNHPSSSRRSGIFGRTVALLGRLGDNQRNYLFTLKAMTEPITAALILGLAAQKFAESAAGKSAEKLIEQLWNKIAARFKGRKKAEAALTQLEASKGKDAEAEANLVRVLDAEMFEDDAFADQLQQMAQQIIHIQNQNQTQAMNTFVSNDSSQMRAVGQVYGTANLGDQK